MPLIAFLDQNKWIELAKIKKENPTSNASNNLYYYIKELTTSGKLVIPLTASNIIETSKRNEVASRLEVAMAQADLSQGYVFRSRLSRISAEVRNFLIQEFKLSARITTKEEMIALGFMQAFPEFDILTASEEEKQITNVINDNLSPMNVYIEYMLHQNDTTRRMAHKVFQLESDQLVENIERRRAELINIDSETRKRAYAASCIYTNQNAIHMQAENLGISHERILTIIKKDPMYFIRQIPTLHSEIELSQKLESMDRPVHRNDLMDMMSYYTVLPYTQIIVAERVFHSIIKQSNLHKHNNLFITTKLSDIKNKL